MGESERDYELVFLAETSQSARERLVLKFNTVRGREAKDGTMMDGRAACKTIMRCEAL